MSQRRPALTIGLCPRERESSQSGLTIVGGGLAGIAAAVEATRRGLRVELFEQAQFLGGRAGSLVDSQTGQLIDCCPHVAMGCCTEFLDFCQRTGIMDCFERTGKLHFIGPDGLRRSIAANRWLPAPMHLLPALMRLNYLSLGERWGIARTLRRLAGLCDGSSETLAIGAWLRAQGQTAAAIAGFWSVVLDSALGETVDYASLAAAAKVFRDGFLASRRSSDLLLPRRPLREIFHDRVASWLNERGVRLHLGAAVRCVEGEAGRVNALLFDDGTRRPVEQAILAVPWRRVRSLLAANLRAAMPALTDIERIESAAITAIHLWFDRPVVPLPHAVLVGRLGQWVFASGKSLDGPHPNPLPAGEGTSERPRPAGTLDRSLPEGVGTAARQHCQVVVSASHRLPQRKPDEWLADIASELQAIWPSADPPRLLHGRVITQPSALFSVQPGVDSLRPPQRTPVANLALAGDWTATGWPATMESAVRSGRLAVESLGETA